MRSILCCIHIEAALSFVGVKNGAGNVDIGMLSYILNGSRDELQMFETSE
jgi:hypothetical protein